jgi:hypothetical protein
MGREEPHRHTHAAGTRCSPMQEDDHKHLCSTQQAHRSCVVFVCWSSSSLRGIEEIHPTSAWERGVLLLTPRQPVTAILTQGSGTISRAGERRFIDIYIYSSCVASAA